MGTQVPVVEGVFTSANGGVNVAFADTGAMVYVRGRGPGATAQRSMVWLDRMGREEPLKAAVRAFIDPRLSPDAQRIAIQILDESNDIWTLDLVRGALTRQTFERVEDETPMWSPDGQWIAYASTEGAQSTVFRRRSDGTGPPEALWSAPDKQTHTHVGDWTADGRTLLISRTQAPGSPQSDIAVLKLDGDQTAAPLLRSPFSM